MSDTSPPPVRTPDRRGCERCGRCEVWDDEVLTWRVRRDEEGRPEANAVGNPYCIHEWDIDGDDGFSPCRSAGSADADTGT